MNDCCLLVGLIFISIHAVFPQHWEQIPAEHSSTITCQSFRVQGLRRSDVLTWSAAFFPLRWFFFNRPLIGRLRGVDRLFRVKRSSDISCCSRLRAQLRASARPHAS